MKKAALVSVVLLAFCVGCATFFGGIVTMTEVENSAMTQWGSMSKRNLTTPQVDAKVIMAHNQYRVACGKAQEALVAYKQNANQTAYIQALETARVAAQGVIDLVVPLLSVKNGQKLQEQLNKATTI